MLPQTMQLFCNQTERQKNMQSSDKDHTSVHTVTPDKLIKFIEPLINENSVQKIQTLYEFHIKNTNTDVVDIIFLNLKYNCGSCGLGRFNALDARVDCTIKLSANDLNEILMERLSPFNAYMYGNIEVDGNLQDVIKLKSILSSVPSINKLIDV
jgi:hypothetical protein